MAVEVAVTVGMGVAIGVAVAVAVRVGKTHVSAACKSSQAMGRAPLPRHSRGAASWLDNTSHYPLYGDL